MARALGPANVDASPARALLPAFVVLLGIAALIARSPFRIDHDSALYLDCARALLSGARPYVDFVDLNPPFVIYLHAVPVALAGLLRVPVIPVFLLGVLAVAAASAAWLGARLLRSPAWSAAAAPAATTWALVSAYLLVSLDFGQREHLTALLYVPFLLDRSLRFGADDEPTTARGERIALGVAAGCALCLKPQFLAAAAVTEAALLIAARDLRRWLDAGLLAALGVLVAYALHFLALPAAVREAFFGRWVPLVAARYHVYDVPLGRLLVPALLATTVAAGIAWVAALAAPKERGVVVGALALFAMASAAIFFAQHKGWNYHRVPLSASAALLATLLASRAVASWPDGGGAWPSRSAAFLLPVLAGLVVLLLDQPLGPARRGPARARSAGFSAAPAAASSDSPESVIARVTRPGEPVLIVATDVAVAEPLLLRMDRRPGSRYLWFFPVAMLADSGRSSAGPPPEPARVPWIAAEERRMLADLTEDLRARRPPLVLLSSRPGPYGCRPGFRVSDYLARRGFVPALARDYAPAPSLADFEVFVRRDRVARPIEARP